MGKTLSAEILKLVRVLLAVELIAFDGGNGTLRSYTILPSCGSPPIVFLGERIKNLSGSVWYAGVAYLEQLRNPSKFLCLAHLNCITCDSDMSNTASRPHSDTLANRACGEVGGVPGKRKENRRM